MPSPAFHRIASILPLALALAACEDARSPAPEPNEPDRANAAEQLAHATSPALTVETTSGVVLGKMVGEIRAFLGIPYAEPPIGERRFAPPVAKAPWSGVLDAREFGAICPQAPDAVMDLRAPGAPMSEDCLTLNVYSPSSPPPKGAPVLVFIHGGGFATGGSSAYEADRLAHAGDMVVVTLNYRLGALGFLAHPALDQVLGMPSGNMGLRDQQLALRWVQDNITAFGGDPEQITLAGQSAGAISACLHMFLEDSQDLPNTFILQSATCIVGEGRPWSEERMKQTAGFVVDDICKGQSDVVACLRNVPAQDLVHWVPPTGALISPLFGIPTEAIIMPWSPYLDGELIPEPPVALLRAGKFAEKPVLFGTTTLEYELLVSKYQTPVPEHKWLLRFLTALYFPEYQTGKVLKHYAPIRDVKATWTRLMSDGLFRCPARMLARELTRQGVPAYYYHFDIPPSTHCQDLDYIFGWTSNQFSSWFPEAPAVNPKTVAIFQNYWTSFIRKGVPSASGQPVWPIYDEARDENLLLAEPITLERGLSQDDCDFWDKQYARE